MPRASNRRRTSRGLRLPEFLACAGVALLGCWPGEPLSSSQLTLVGMCLLPLTLRALFRRDDSATPGPVGPADVFASGASDRTSDLAPDRTSDPTAEPARVPEPATRQRALVGLAVLDVAPEGLVVRQANRALSDLLGPVAQQALFGSLVAADDRVLAHAAVLDVVEGRVETWTGELAFLVRPAAGVSGETGRCLLRIEVSLLPAGTEAPARASLRAIEITAGPAEQELAPTG